MQLGYGVTAWERGKNSGHLDGIGVYTQALYEALLPQKIDMKPLIFSRYRLLWAILLGMRAPSAVQLVHAPDHYIPILRGVPLVATVMDLIPFIHPEWTSNRLRALKNWLFKRSIVSASHLITISEYSRMDLIRHFNIPAEKISVTPLGVDAVYFSPISPEVRHTVLQRYALSPDFFLFIGTLQPRKNLARLLDAHALLPLALRQRHPVVVVGRNGWGVDELLPRLHELTALGTVRWLDYVPRDDILALLQSARALIFVSLYEGFGLPVLEAFAAGCAVIASNTTSIPEVAGNAALLVDPLNPNGIADAMQQLLVDDTLRTQLREQGRARAQQFTWDACAQATLAVYNKLLLNKV
jgi:alpha-1,3-rhamnosyl/mannosyltransferase